ncbi:MAG TPA: GIY-YIG nuclease family protein [Sphingobacteriaceae bacterium]|nr:GIY-YIG nuclease family protein [Sphingobacteriaceae bacterium]
MYTVYVLYSVKFNKIYIGYTSDIQDRLLSHNHLATKGYTIKFRPWAILFTEEYLGKADALRREKVLKTGKGREFIWRLISERTN